MSSSTHRCRVEGVELISDHWTRQRVVPASWLSNVKAAHAEVRGTSTVTWDLDGRARLRTSTPPPLVSLDLTAELRNSWPTFEWAGNPWIVNHDGEQLKERRFTQLRQCRLAEANVRRVNDSEWTFAPRINGGRWTQKRRARLIEWILSVVIFSPPLAVGQPSRSTRKSRSGTRQAEARVHVDHERAGSGDQEGGR